MEEANEYVLTGIDKQDHLFNNPPELEEARSKESARDDPQIISMLWN